MLPQDGDADSDGLSLFTPSLKSCAKESDELEAFTLKDGDLLVTKWATEQEE